MLKGPSHILCFNTKYISSNANCTVKYSYEKNTAVFYQGGNDDQALHVKSSEYALEGEKASESHETRENSSEKQMPNPDISESASKDEVSMWHTWICQ